MNHAVFEKIRGGLIVSCQALENEPLYGPDTMIKMAIAAKQGGAVGIRANSGSDIRGIKKAVDLPIIGLVKRTYPNQDVFITPTLKEVEEVVEAGAEIVAVDATYRIRPDGKTTRMLLEEIKKLFPKTRLMADIATLEEGIAATDYGADAVGTTLSGYTSYTKPIEAPDYVLMEQLVGRISVPVIAEGNIRNPDEMIACYDKGVWSVVVGSAITRPQLITAWFVQKLKGRPTP
ncbi:N-acetylmannosamine-6-phosphate 2-epimerase [Paenibacillus oryzisoli]|uniref:N-acetylmannosamine-6-phosphate 2-epimerase n=1 Tax=Paenibacillus oryzisoli TaxID=1850517 RepID=UPI003D2DC452